MLGRFIELHIMRSVFFSLNLPNWFLNLYLVHFLHRDHV